MKRLIATLIAMTLVLSLLAGCGGAATSATTAATTKAAPTAPAGTTAASTGASTVSRRAAFFVGLLGWALAIAGRTSEAAALLEEVRSRSAGAPPVVSDAWLLAALGRVDDAFVSLAEAENEYQPFVGYTGLPGFDPLRDDPRFGALLDRFGLKR